MTEYIGYAKMVLPLKCHSAKMIHALCDIFFANMRREEPFLLRFSWGFSGANPLYRFKPSQTVYAANAKIN